METSWNVYDYPTQPEEEMKTIKGKIIVEYKFEIEVPAKWEEDEIRDDIYNNLSDYQQDEEIIDWEVR